MVLVPLLIRLAGLDDRDAFASAVAVILPLCAVSIAMELVEKITKENWFDFDVVVATPDMENGVDIVDIPDPGALRERTVETFQLPKDRRILLFVGQQIWQKNLRLILDVTKQLQPEGRYLTVIAGKGYDSEAICRYAESLDLGGCVKFTGGITDRDLLRGLYLASDLFFFPSLYDNAPLVLREAALMSKWNSGSRPARYSFTIV